MKVTIKYRIYSVDEKGMLNRPRQSGWRDQLPKYNDFDSMEDACAALEAEGEWASYVILPTTVSSVD